MIEITDEYVESGDMVELGDVQDSTTSVTTGGKLHIIAAWTDEPTEYVILKFHAPDDETIEADGQVLSIEDGNGMSSPSVWMIVEKSQYNAGAE